MYCQQNSEISLFQATESLDNKGVEVDVSLANGISGKACITAGEEFGNTKAVVDYINCEVAPKFIGKNAMDVILDDKILAEHKDKCGKFFLALSLSIHRVAAAWIDFRIQQIEEENLKISAPATTINTSSSFAYDCPSAPADLSKNKTAPVAAADSSALAYPIPADPLRCNVKSKGWRCLEPRLKCGSKCCSKYCPHHYSAEKKKHRKRDDERKEKGKTRKTAASSSILYHLTVNETDDNKIRCKSYDGEETRCTKPVSHGSTYCITHYIAVQNLKRQLRAKASGSSSAAAEYSPSGGSAAAVEYSPPAAPEYSPSGGSAAAVEYAPPAAAEYSPPAAAAAEYSPPAAAGYSPSEGSAAAAAEYSPPAAAGDSPSGGSAAPEYSPSGGSGAA